MAQGHPQSRKSPVRMAIIDLCSSDSSDEVVPVVLPGCVSLLNRVQVQQFALTYPQNDCLPSVALRNILERESVIACGVKYCVVAQEAHKDGTPHLHVFLMLSKPFRYTRGEGSTWDFVTGKHGNYQRMKFPANWLVYVTKGREYVKYPDSFDVQAFISSRKKKTSYKHEIIAKKILAGQRDMKDLVANYPGYIIVNQRKVVSFIDLCEDLDQIQMPLLKFPDVVQVGVLSAPQVHVLKWFVRVQTGYWKDYHLDHLRIEGPTGIGKTYLMQLLTQYLRMYSVVYETNWWDSFSQDAFDVIVLDEFKSQKKIQLLNRIADGAMVPLPRRGTRPYILKSRVPIVILSNFDWENSYPNVALNAPVVLAAAQRRFETVVFDQGEDLMSLVYLVKSWIDASKQ